MQEASRNEKSTVNQFTGPVHLKKDNLPLVYLLIAKDIVIQTFILYKLLL